MNTSTADNTTIRRLISELLICGVDALCTAAGERIENEDIRADGAEQRVEAQVGASE